MAGGSRAPRGATRGVARRAEAARRETRTSPRGTRPPAREPPVSKIYRDMLAEAGVTTSPSRMTSDAVDVPSERPLKRPRTGRRPAEIAGEASRAPKPNHEHNVSAELSKSRGVAKEAVEDSEAEDEDIEFEDIDIPKPTIQTTYLSSEDDTEEEEDIQFEDVDIDATASQQAQADDSAGTLQLNLTAAREALTPSKPNRKQPLTKAEKERRVELHRTHLLCLLAHVEKRNHWCNDPVVHRTLRPLLGAKTIQFLNPGPNLTQFGQTESLKRGLKEAQDVFREKFRITEIGLRRALWAEDKSELLNWEAPSNIDNCLDKADFRKAAQSLKGSRDVGAMLFCALLRAVGVEARLVCSLQPLSFVPGGPTLPKSRPAPAPPQPRSQPAEPAHASPSSSRPSARRRLGHPNAAAYHVPEISARPPSSARSYHTAPRISESSCPVYWTEILDIGHQKWQPVDALVTGMHFRPHKLEPAIADRKNLLTYVVAFEDDGAAKDVTRRYAKAYNSKTRRMRIDGPLVPASVEGSKWWRKALRRYKPRGSPSDLEQIETTELNATEAREPMPRNVSDFKHHPIYALARHLRRHEVFVPGAKVVGTVGAGSKGPLEKIYRRRDVRVAHSADKWYRMGREILPGQESVKVVRKRKAPKRKGRWHLRATPEAESSDDDPVLGPDPAKGTPLYMFDQTRLYVAPPVVAGRVPKNRFGNLDVYVPTMVPAGGIHIKHARAGHAAHVLGVDYAPALQGFEFKGRTGTAVYNGVVVPFAAAEGVWAVLEGFDDLEAQMEAERRSRRALETWRNWLRTLTIRRRLFEGDTYWGDTELGEVEAVEEEDSADDDDKPRDGGFILDDEGGGFEPGGFEPGGFEPGGFEPGGFEPGGFEPEGSGPGGFEPSGFEPGGFEADELEAGGFEPDEYQAGGFEVDVPSKGKGKEPERRLNHHSANGPPKTSLKDLDGVDEAYTPEPGGFETNQNPADVYMQEAPATPAGIPSTIEARLPDNAQGASPGSESDLSSPPPTPTDEEVADGGGSAIPRGSLDASGGAEPEDLEIKDAEEETDEPGDAESDVTEELFMDEDGSLIE